jgi:hypothetical protein
MTYRSALPGLEVGRPELGTAWGRARDLRLPVDQPGCRRRGGYSIVAAASLEDATAKAAGCPVLQAGGTVEIYEGMAM